MSVRYAALTHPTTIMITNILKSTSSSLRQYLLITANYWAFTLTDGALRMLVVLHFHQLGYGPLAIALLFVFYEVFGVITNCVGGWLGASWGLNKTMNIGLGLQVIALSMLLVPSELLSMIWVMAAQALSGIAKDLNKMSAKSSIKILLPDKKNNEDYNDQRRLYKWVARLTGSKNALKGAGFFLGGVLLTLFGFQTAIAIMALALSLVWLISISYLKKDLGKTKHKAKFKQIFSKSPAINILSAARLFLFGARDVWFVVALPVYLATQLNWSHSAVGSFLALWIIGYGFVQTLAPTITKTHQNPLPDGMSAFRWALALALISAIIASALSVQIAIETVLVSGLIIFGILFAINSSLHSYLIVSYASDDRVSLDIGFYYMANAMGRLTGTVLSGWVYQAYGLAACLWISTGFIALAAAISLWLPRRTAPNFL